MLILTKHFGEVVALVLLVGVVGGSSAFGGEARPAPQPRDQRQPEARYTRRVSVNGVRLSDSVLRILETSCRVRIAEGDYWYDKVSGAWGVTGGPTCGFVLPGLDLGGPLRADASAGDTGVFITGRQLHRLDVVMLQQVTPVYRGRYWVNALGYCGFEGNPVPFMNLGAMVQAKQSRSSGGGAYNRSTAGGGIGGDGEGNFYFIDRNSSVSVTR
jgi:hypothetical protein